jgi:beta-galactosidase/beta-glucuronidase
VPQGTGRLSFDPDHPRPTRQRRWWSLDGTWEFAAEEQPRWRHPREVEFAGTIVVPFAPETPASESGVASTARLRQVWYRRAIEIAPRADDDRVVLHVGAADRHTVVWVSGNRAAEHLGGYTPVSCDITPFLEGTGEQQVELVVQVDDDPGDLTVARGKQEWRDEPHLIWYPRTTGIWQTVWLEVVPAVSIADLWWQGSPDDLSLALTARIDGPQPADLDLLVELELGERLLARERSSVISSSAASSTVERRFVLGDRGVDDIFSLVWRPRNPVLVAARLALVTTNDRVVDEVVSYAAIRSVTATGGRVLLNGRERKLRLALDQGYWPESGLTAPSTAALREDVELALAAGFNGVRKHQKIEDPRWLYWCDRLGLLVWEEMPSALTFDPSSFASTVHEWSQIVLRSRNHPSVIVRVPFNESWGVPLAGRSPQQRAAIEALAALTKALDPSRLVSSNDGWETTAGDIVGIHDYQPDPGVLVERYATRAAIARLVDGDPPSGRPILLAGAQLDDETPIVLSEFGGLTRAEEDTEGLFGYGNTGSSEDLGQRYAALCRAASEADGLAGWCWTQLTDTYQEANGLFTMDRRPKLPLEALRAATHGRWIGGSAAGT